MSTRIAVVTPYYREPDEMLRTCLESVADQTIPCTHFVVADGFPSQVVDGSRGDIQHVRLPKAHGDNGNTPRGVGTLVALAQNFDFIAYLDADNWYWPTHIESLLDLHEATGAPVLCSKRTFHRLDGSLMEGVTEAAEDAHLHADTSCYLIHRSCDASISIWSRMPRPLSPLCDRVFFHKLVHDRWPMAFSDERSVAFRSQYVSHYRMAKENPPQGAKGDIFSEPLRYLRTEEGVAETVSVLGFYPRQSGFLV